MGPFLATFPTVLTNENPLPAESDVIKYTVCPAESGTRFEEPQKQAHN